MTIVQFNIQAGYCTDHIDSITCDKRDNPVGYNPGQAWEKNLENCKEHKIEGQQKTKRGNSHE